MNFFGHAAIAADYFPDQLAGTSARQLPELCAGAMLPDFVTMLRLGKPQVRGAAVARGVAFHHLTDHAFHELESFHGLCRGAFSWLSEHGLPRGPARAVAHIGIEMLLDEIMAERAAARDAYLAALTVPLAQHLQFVNARDAERLSELQLALLERSSAAREAPPELLAARIRRTLAPRPRLAADEAGEATIAAWVLGTRPLVRRAAPELLSTLRSRLANLRGAE